MAELMKPTTLHAMSLPNCRSDLRQYLVQPQQPRTMDLQHAPPAHRNDHHLVLAAVQQDGLALQYAAPHLRNHATIALAAVRTDCRALAFVSEALQRNVTIATAALPWGVEYVSPHLLGDETFMLVAVEKAAFALLFASTALRHSRSFVQAAVETNPWAIFHAPSCMLMDVDIVTKAMECAVEARDYARVRSLWRLEGCRALKQELMDIGTILRADGSLSIGLRPLETPADYAFRLIVDSRMKQQYFSTLMERAPSEACEVCTEYLRLTQRQVAATNLAKYSRLILATAKGHELASWWIFFDSIRDA